MSVNFWGRRAETWQSGCDEARGLAGSLFVASRDEAFHLGREVPRGNRCSSWRRRPLTQTNRICSGGIRATDLPSHGVSWRCLPARDGFLAPCVAVAVCAKSVAAYLRSDPSGEYPPIRLLAPSEPPLTLIDPMLVLPRVREARSQHGWPSHGHMEKVATFGAEGNTSAKCRVGVQRLACDYPNRCTIHKARTAVLPSPVIRAYVSYVAKKSYAAFF
jgi:hypothetical protein